MNEFSKAYLAAKAEEKNKVMLYLDHVDINDGYLHDAVLFSQIMYWHIPNKKNKLSKMRVLHDGKYWIAKNHDDWYAECRIKAPMVRKALKRIEERNLIHYTVTGYSAKKTPLIRINWKGFEAAISLQYDTLYQTNMIHCIESNTDTTSTKTTKEKDIVNAQAVDERVHSKREAAIEKHPLVEAAVMATLNNLIEGEYDLSISCEIWDELVKRGWAIEDHCDGEPTLEVTDKGRKAVSDAGTIWHKEQYSSKYDTLTCEECGGIITDTFYHYGGWYRYKVHCAGCWLKKYGSVDNSDNTQFDNGGYDDRQCVKCGALAVIGDDIPYVGDVQTPDGGYKHGLLCPKCAGYDDECIVEIHTDDNATADMTAKAYPRSELVKPRNWNDLQDCSGTERCEAQQADDTVHEDHTCDGCGTVAALNKHGYCDDCVSAMRDAKLPKAKKVTAHTAMKNALVAAMGYTNEEITCWGDYNKASKLLRKAGVEPEEIPGMHAFCMAWARKGNYTFKSPMQLAKDLPEYRKQQRQAEADTDTAFTYIDED